MQVVMIEMPGDHTEHLATFSSLLRKLLLDHTAAIHSKQSASLGQRYVMQHQSAVSHTNMASKHWQFYYLLNLTPVGPTFGLRRELYTYQYLPPVNTVTHSRPKPYISRSNTKSNRACNTYK